MIKIFTNHQFISEQNRRIIFPLLFDLCYLMNENLLNKYTLVDSILESDIVIVPVDIAYFFKNNKQKWLYDSIDEANRLNKKVWVYSSGDIGITLNASVYTFRLGGFNSRLDDKTFIMSAYSIDPYVFLNKVFKPLPKSELPTIGFVGHANGSFVKWGKEFLIYGYSSWKRIFKKSFSDYQPFYPSSTKRHQFLTRLKKNKLIVTDFIFRTQYRAGHRKGESKEKTTTEFFENMCANGYTFCLRGTGNFSVRFYETLAMGRIPLVIDTDFRLPLEHLISWENHCIIATEHNFAEKLINFHKSIGEEEFEKMQINNRNLWLNHLNREGYFNEIYAYFKELI